MGSIIIIFLVGLAFLGLTIYGLAAPGVWKKKGRRVDARVLSCEMIKLNFQNTGEESYYFKISVDFYGLNGETIVKEVSSEKSYEVGDVVRSLYIDKKDKFLLDENKELVRVTGNKKVTAFVICLMILIIFAVMMMNLTSNDTLGELLSYLVGYSVSILFAGYGIYLIVNNIGKRNKENIEVITGTQISYDKEFSRSEHGSRYLYKPIYEYEYGGDRCLFHSTVGSNTKKYRTIGRKVHMIRNRDTGEVTCREDEETSLKLYIIMAIAGLIMLSFMAVKTIQDSTAVPQEVNVNAEADLPAYNLFVAYQNETSKKCAYSIDFYENGQCIVTLFPMVTVKDRSIEQTISFTLEDKTKKELYTYFEKLPLNTSSSKNVDKNDEMIVHVYKQENDARIGGYMPEGADYGDITTTVLSFIPSDVKNEMLKRETEYYQ